MSRRNELIRRLLSGLTDSEFENLVRVREEARHIPAPRRQREARSIPTPRRPVPTARKIGLKQLIRYFENNPIPPYRPVPTPKMKKQQPVLAPRTRIGEKRRALKGLTKSYEIGLKSDRDALIQLQNTRLAINRLFGTILKFVETLKVTFDKRKDEHNIYKPAYFSSRAQIVINPNDVLPSLGISQQQLLNGISVWLSEGSGWTIRSIDEHYINTVVYEPTKGSSYIRLPAELRNSTKGLVNMKNDDNECFRWCHIRYLNPQEDHLYSIKKSDIRAVEELNYQGTEFPISVKEYTKIEVQNRINVNVFRHEDKQFYRIFVSKQNNNDVLNLLLITEGEKKHYVPIKDFKSLMYNKTKHRDRKHFCMHCLQCFSAEEVLSKHKTNCMVINGEQAIRMPQKGNNILQFQNYHKLMSAPFVIYADFEAISENVQGCLPWVPEVFSRVRRGASFRRPKAEDTSGVAARKNL